MMPLWTGRVSYWTVIEDGSSAWEACTEMNRSSRNACEKLSWLTGESCFRAFIKVKDVEGENRSIDHRMHGVTMTCSQEIHCIFWLCAVRHSLDWGDLFDAITCSLWDTRSMSYKQTTTRFWRQCDLVNGDLTGLSTTNPRAVILGDRIILNDGYVRESLRTIFSVLSLESASWYKTN